MHKSTFEITKDTHLSLNGDCIIAVGADKSASDLSPEFRMVMRNSNCNLTTALSCQDVSVDIKSKGSPTISLTHNTDLVWRLVILYVTGLLQL